MNKRHASTLTMPLRFILILVTLTTQTRADYAQGRTLQEQPFNQDAPSSFPSDFPSLAPATFVVNSDYPSTAPSILPTLNSDYPSLVPSSLPSSSENMPTTDSSIPSQAPSSLGEVTVVDSVLLETKRNDIMDDGITATFEDVCQNDFLPWYLGRIYPATYVGIECIVLQQNRLDEDGSGRQRKLAEEEYVSVIELYTTYTRILMRVKGTADLPGGLEYADILRRTFTRYILQFQGLLAEKTLYFEEVEDPTTIVGIVDDRGTGDEDSGVPQFVVIGSALLGAGIAVGLSLFYIRNQNSKKQQFTSAHDVTDDSVLLLFDMENKGKEESSPHSYSYLPPTPFGLGVPTEIGPHSWIEPDDELSQESPDNQRTESAFAMNQQSQEAQAICSGREKILPKSRAAEILASLTAGSEQLRNFIPYQTYSHQNSAERLKTLETTESADDTSKPTLSSKGSHPTKRSAGSWNSRRTYGSQSEASSTLHGLNIVGTISGYQDSEANNSSSKGSVPESPKVIVSANQLKNKRQSPLKVETGVCRSVPSKSIIDQATKDRTQSKQPDSANRRTEESTFTNSVTAIASVFHDIEQSFDHGKAESARKWNKHPIPPINTASDKKDTAEMEHTGNVLKDLGMLEDAMDGQLESNLSASATTPRRANSEKARKTSRPRSFREEDV